MPNQSRLMLSSSSSSQITSNSGTTRETGSSRVRRSQPQNPRSRRPQRGMGVAKLEKLRTEALQKKMLEDQNLLYQSAAPLVPCSNISILHSALQNSQPSHNFLRSYSPLRNVNPDFNRPSSEYLQNFGRNNNSLHPQHFQSSLNNCRTATTVLQQTQSSRRNIPNAPSVQTTSYNPPRSVIDPARIFPGMVAPNRAQMHPSGYVGAGTAVQTSRSQFSLLCDLCVKKQRTSQERAVLNVVENRNNSYDPLRSGPRSSGGQYANNNLGGSVMPHSGLIAAPQQRFGIQTVNGYKRNEIEFGYEMTPGEGGQGIGLLEGAPPVSWSYWTALPAAVVSPTTPNSSITSFHSEDTTISGADTIDLNLKLSI